MPGTAPQVVNAVTSGQRLPIPSADVLPGAGEQFAGLDDYLDLMQACWAVDPKDRPSFGDVLAKLRCEWTEYPGISVRGGGGQSVGAEGARRVDARTRGWVRHSSKCMWPMTHYPLVSHLAVYSLLLSRSRSTSPGNCPCRRAGLCWSWLGRRTRQPPRAETLPPGAASN